MQSYEQEEPGRQQLWSHWKNLYFRTPHAVQSLAFSSSAIAEVEEKILGLTLGKADNGDSIAEFPSKDELEFAA